MARHESIVNTGVFSHQPYVQISTGAEGQARKGYIWIMGGGGVTIYIYIYNPEENLKIEKHRKIYQKVFFFI